MHELPAGLARLNPQNFLHLRQTELAQLPDAPHLAHDVLHVLRSDARERAQKLLGRGIDPRAHVRVFLGPNDDRFRRIRLEAVGLQVLEDLGGRIGRRRPDDTDSREGQGEKNKFGLDAGCRGIDRFRSRTGLLLGGIFSRRFCISFNIRYGLIRMSDSKQ